MEEDEFITIKRSDYHQLVADSEKLLALENAGVDNWSGYDDALGDLWLTIDK
jgi:hypothetical protein